MTLVVACRAADGALVLGSDQLFTSDNEIQFGKKLFYQPMLNGGVLIGIAAENVTHGFSRMVALQMALSHVTFDRDPIVVIQERIKDIDSIDADNEIAKEVAILAGIASPGLEKPKLFGIFDREIHDLNENRFFCVGSGAIVAQGFLELVSENLISLRDAQVVAGTAVWLAKRTPTRCGGGTDISWLDRDSGKGDLEAHRVEALERYIETAPPQTIAQWIANAPL